MSDRDELIGFIRRAAMTGAPADARQVWPLLERLLKVEQAARDLLAEPTEEQRRFRLIELEDALEG